MDGKKVLEVIGIYRDFFEKLHIPKVNAPHDKFVGDSFLNTLSHCHAMLDEMEQFVSQGKMDKVFRWLGFIQGCLWSANGYTLDELKNHNRTDSVEKR